MPDSENSRNNKLSIVIPVYNEKDTILDLLDRVLAIKLPDKEIIVVDDGSQDGTGEKIKNFSESVNSIKVVCHKKIKVKGLLYGADSLLQAVI